MGQLRDVMKCEKKEGGLIREFLNEENPDIPRKNRIKMSGDSEVATDPQGIGHKNFPDEHFNSRKYKGWKQAKGTSENKDANIYKVKKPVGNEPKRFDVLEGTSPTTIDMINFFLVQNRKKGMERDENVDSTTKLMQVFYACLLYTSPSPRDA